MKILFEKYHFVLILLWLFGYLLFNSTTPKNLNHTIGWGWDITNIIAYFIPLQVVIIAVGCLIIYLQCRKFPLTLSITLISTIILVCTTSSNMLLIIGMWALFIANISQSTKISKYKDRTPS